MSVCVVEHEFRERRCHRGLQSQNQRPLLLLVFVVGAAAAAAFIVTAAAAVIAAATIIVVPPLMLRAMVEMLSVESTDFRVDDELAPVQHRQQTRNGSSLP